MKLSVLALDYDGTIARNDRLDPGVREAIAYARRRKVIVLLVTPLIRPFTLSRILWTYLLPLVPLTCWWDGIVSQLRAYTP